ncbi:5-oxoprolinase subunit B family protein [Actinokineospora sp. NPDC004072]
MRLRRCGPLAALVELGSLAEVAAARAVLAGLPGAVDVVPAARTVLVTFAAEVPRDLADVLRAADLAAPPPAAGDTVVLPTIYDGPDLALVAETAGVGVAEAVALHTGAEYAVAFTGFAPGFGYLTGLPAPLRQARLDSPRTRVPAGAVGVAGEFTGVYPRPSPGGWRLLGRLAPGAPALFDADRDPPALLSPGLRVRFEAVACAP